MARTKSKDSNASTATIGFEANLWLTAEQAVPAPHFAEADYNGARPEGLLGLIFLKYISDTFEDHRTKLIAGKGDYKGANAEDPDTAMRASARCCFRRSRIPQDFCQAKDQYKAENVFWVPKEARWSHLQANAKQPTIGKTVDDANGGRAQAPIERDNPRLKGVLPKDYARPGLDKQRPPKTRSPHRRGVVADFATAQTERRQKNP